MIRKVAVLALAVPALALAQVARLEIGSPTFKPLPIAVAPFHADAGASPEAAETQQVLAWDLHLSGLFLVLDPKSFLAPADEGITAGEIAFQRWGDVGAQALVKARVRRAGDEVGADAHLYDVNPGREALARDVHGASPRAAGHELADEIVRYYTREPGVFSTRIAAVRKGRGVDQLVLYDADGRSGQVVVEEEHLTLPAWRPDGGAVAYTSWRGGHPALWIFDLATRQRRKLAEVGRLTTGVCFSPDGTRIAFAATQGTNSDIFVANANGTGLARLTTDAADDGAPSWSPDGRRIAFSSTRSGTSQIFVMNADGTDQRRLTFQGKNNTSPRWSPRGDLIAFTARDEYRAFDVFVISPDSAKIRRVTQGTGRTNWEPTWAPNGRLLAFSSDRNGRMQLVVSTVDGDRQTVVTAEALDVETPAWGPLPRR
jgi:TolB protein